MKVEKKELPRGWSWEDLGRVCEITMGQSPPSSSYNKDGIGLPFFQGKAEFTDLYPIEEKWCTEPSKIAEVNDVLLSVRAPVGSTNIANQKCCIGRGLASIRFENHKYLFYYLRSIVHELDSKGTGTTFRAISGKAIKDTPLPVAPKATQQAIVAKIEELFSELDKGVESLRKAQQQLKMYRQSVLKWAFQSHSGESSCLKEVTIKIQIGPFGTQLHKDDYIENEIPLINPTHIKGGLIVADNSFTISKMKRDSLPNYILEENDIIMGRRGEMGRCGLVTTKEAGWFCGTGSLYFRPDVHKVDPRYLYHYLRSEVVKKYLDENAGGTTMANLNLKVVNNIPVTVPTIEEQGFIVQSIESRLSVADKLEETITKSLQQAEALKQSILKKAFEGKLI